ncbi:hypothetical protein GGR95_000986 [Sulfitobacter undariae]|uniref:DoxX-like family protein n=1 Tax=Sulfitobacter undariae TaxID=1563671 RepID=A0A7W6E7V2_9RHOB|nr:hypothetical protein [Sulfitobacter undariae]MBB3993358.1 hypothetical protein [Sulfitobacter undariae]
MSSTTLPLNTPIWLKAISILGIIWYAFGLLQFWLAYSMDTTAAASAGTITTAHAAAIAGTPALVWLTFAVASGAGLLGAAALFIGSGRAKLLFAISAISALVYYIWLYAISGTGADRPSEELPIAVVVVVVTLGFLFLNKRTHP